MMYCEECGALFEYPDMTKDFEYEYEGGHYYKYIAVCPMCGSDEIRTANVCPICGETHEGEDDICDNCREEIDGIVADLVSKAIDMGMNWEALSDELAERLVNEI